MKKVVIIGGGFGGISAALKLAARKELVDLTLIDQRDDFTFLPLLPDIIGRELSRAFLTFPIGRIASQNRFHFTQAKVIALDLDHNSLRTEQAEIGYDYLLVAAGTETNFYGRDDLARQAFKLDNAEDGEKIHQAVLSGEYATFLIGGGGYTGVEVATNLRLLLDKRKMAGRIIIVEVGSALLGPLPDWMKEFVSGNLKALNIEVRLKNSLKQTEGKKITLVDGEQFDQAMLIWAAGVKTSEAVFNLPIEKNRQGRLAVDDYLRFRSNCFAAGDCAAVGSLRMAARFAIQQGRVAAENIIHSIKGERLKKYRPFDWGYLVPMANNRACGIILGRNQKGFLGILAHYFLCVWLSWGWRNRLGIVKELIGGAKK